MRWFLRQSELGNLAPIAAVMLLVALHLCVCATFERKAGHKLIAM